MAKRQEPALPTLAEVESAQRELEKRRKRRQNARRFLAVLLAVAALAVLAERYVVSAVRVNGESMEPSYYDGDVLFYLHTNQVEVGEVYCVSYGNKLLIKRVVGLPGDVIDIEPDGTVKVNGNILDEPYISEKSKGECDLVFPYVVPQGHYFLLGDHRSVSMDSRTARVGSVGKEQFMGKVIGRLRPVFGSSGSREE